MRGCESRRWIPSRDSKNAIDDQLQDASSVLDAFYIVKLAGDALDEVRRRVPREMLGHRWAQAIPATISGFFCAPRATSSPHVNKNDSAQPSRQMRRISVWKSPTTAPSKCAMSSIRTPPPKADAWPLVSSRAYQRVPSPIARLGRTLRKWKDAFSAYFDTGGASNGPTEAINGIIELGRRIARGYRNPTNYQLRMLLIAGGLDAPPTLNSEEPANRVFVLVAMGLSDIEAVSRTLRCGLSSRVCLLTTRTAERTMISR